MKTAADDSDASCGAEVKALLLVRLRQRDAVAYAAERCGAGQESGQWPLRVCDAPACLSHTAALLLRHVACPALSSKQSRLMRHSLCWHLQADLEDATAGQQAGLVPDAEADVVLDRPALEEADRGRPHPQHRRQRDEGLVVQPEQAGLRPRDRQSVLPTNDRSRLDCFGTECRQQRPNQYKCVQACNNLTCHLTCQNTAVASLAMVCRLAQWPMFQRGVRREEHRIGVELRQPPHDADRRDDGARDA